MYVDAIKDQRREQILVVERTKDGSRKFQEYPIKYQFYYADPKGKYRSIEDKPLSKITCKSSKEYQKELAMFSHKKTYESDLNPIFVALSDNYLGMDMPKLHVAFFDLETAFCPERGYASPEDAFMPITSISVYLQWIDTLICLAVPPPSLNMGEAKELVQDMPNTLLFNNEAEMLSTFLDLIVDADVLSGWNSEGYDIPYTVNRITQVLSRHDTSRLCLWQQIPKRREYERYGKTLVTYDLVGRVHLDYLQLYKKYTYEERHSYKLDTIGELEVGEKKVQYEGTLDQLYHNDFKKFIEYNRQDTLLLDKLDKKLKFIDLSNAIAHENTVLLQTTMGAVAVTEQAIINEAHRLNLVIPDRKKNIINDDSDDGKAAGAYVAYPKKGIHLWIGSLDINSLYPSAIRALNMGPDTIIGQLRQTATDAYVDKQVESGKSFAASWEGIFGSLEYDAVMKQDVGTIITVDWEDGTSVEMSAAEIHKMVFDSNLPIMLSANGTLFTLEREGVIPGLLKNWYAERKAMQKKLKEVIGYGNGITAPDQLIQEVEKLLREPC